MISTSKDKTVDGASKCRLKSQFKQCPRVHLEQLCFSEFRVIFGVAQKTSDFVLFLDSEQRMTVVAALLGHADVKLCAVAEFDCLQNEK